MCTVRDFRTFRVEMPLETQQICFKPHLHKAPPRKDAEHLTCTTCITSVRSGFHQIHPTFCYFCGVATFLMVRVTRLQHSSASSHISWVFCGYPLGDPDRITAWSGARGRQDGTSWDLWVENPRLLMDLLMKHW